MLYAMARAANIPSDDMARLKAQTVMDICNYGSGRKGKQNIRDATQEDINKLFK